MRKTILLVYLFLGFSNISLGQETTTETVESTTSTSATVILEIEGMACQEGCADAISANLKKTEGIDSAVVSYSDKKAEVMYDPKVITISEVESVITETKVKDYSYTINKIIFQ